MEPESRHTLIGAVIVGLVVALAVAILWLSHTGVASDYQHYVIKFERQSLEGLQVGGDVNMRGIKVGRVESFTIERDNINVVHVLIRVERATPVSQNTSAIVARNLLTGIARINLETPGVPGPPLTEIPPGESSPVIAEGTSDLDQIAESANRLVVTAESALANLNSMLTPANRQAFSDTMLALRDLSTGMVERMGHVDTVVGSLDATLRELERTSARIGAAADAFVAQVGPLATDTRMVLSEGGKTLVELREVAGETKTAIADFGAATKEIGAATRQLSSDGLAELALTARDMRAAAAMLSRTAERLSDPRAAVLGPGPRQLGPGETSR
jgi:phospholipid/cholesterol/gamma-HCH transport system substrate-binding protein